MNLRAPTPSKTPQGKVTAALFLLAYQESQLLTVPAGVFDHIKILLQDAELTTPVDLFEMPIFCLGMPQNWDHLPSEVVSYLTSQLENDCFYRKVNASGLVFGRAYTVEDSMLVTFEAMLSHHIIVWETHTPGAGHTSWDEPLRPFTCGILLQRNPNES